MTTQNAACLLAGPVQRGFREGQAAAASSSDIHTKGGPGLGCGLCGSLVKPGEEQEASAMLTLLKEGVMHRSHELSPGEL